jgi:hypothetical protein
LRRIGVLKALVVVIRQSLQCDCGPARMRYPNTGESTVQQKDRLCDIARSIRQHSGEIVAFSPRLDCAQAHLQVGEPKLLDFTASGPSITTASLPWAAQKDGCMQSDPESRTAVANAANDFGICILSFLNRTVSGYWADCSSDAS